MKVLRPNHWNEHLSLISKQVLSSSHNLVKSVVNWTAEWKLRSDYRIPGLGTLLFIWISFSLPCHRWLRDCGGSFLCKTFSGLGIQQSSRTVHYQPKYSNNCTFITWRVHITMLNAVANLLVNALPNLLACIASVSVGFYKRRPSKKWSDDSTVSVPGVGFIFQSVNFHYRYDGGN